MISFKHTGFIIENVSDIERLFPQDLETLLKSEMKGDLIFIIPSKFKSNKNKTIYKIGWLVEFLKFIYPEKKIADFCEIINERYQVFLDRRAIERKMKEYASNDIFK